MSALLLLALGWAWTPVDEALLYEVWAARWGEPWSVVGQTTEPVITDADLWIEVEPLPVNSGDLVCYTVRSWNGELSELPPCCGPCSN